jgi:hypothetical protein
MGLRILSWLAWAGFLVLSGCAATGERFAGLRPPLGEHALVVLYRPDLVRAGAATHTVSIDDKEIGVLRNAGWMTATIQPGRYTLKIDQRFESGTRKSSAPLLARPGETIVFRVSPGVYYPLPVFPFAHNGAWTLQQVAREVAEAEMQDLRRSE